MDLQRTGLQRAARIAVQRADINLRNARATRGLSQGAAELAAHNADQSTELYRQGLSTALQVADANQQRFEAEVASSSDRYALALAYLDLMSAHGMAPPAGALPSTRPTATLVPKD
jgi:outer membrane protein TolC